MATVPGAPTLAAEFAPAEREQWIELVVKLLARGEDPGRDPDATLARLRSTTYDDITIQPLYTADDAIELDEIGLPGFSPFVRGRTADGARAAGWDIRQVVHGAPAATPGRAKDELEHGATSILLDVGDDFPIDGDLLDRALDGVLLDLAAVVLDAGGQWTTAAEALEAVWERRGLERGSATGSLGADPLGDHASTRADRLDDQLAELVSWSGRLRDEQPAVRLVTVDGRRYHDAGASDAEELGCVLAAAVGYLRLLSDAGCALRDAFGQIELRLVATNDQFGTIAKLRAARELWARVAEVLGDAEDAGATPVHAITSSAMMTRYDPWVNLLRTTVACFAAATAGADAITVLPYDHQLGAEGTELGRRLARNTQSILALESNLHRVIDPGGGSWFVERLTRELGISAWRWFQELEANGGFRAAVDHGLVDARIEATRARREKDIDSRRAPLTGVSEFPNVDEAPPAVTPELRAKAEAPVDGDLVPHTYGERFEVLRARVDTAVADGRPRPTVFLATIGSAATFTARVGFAQNFFGVAGVPTLDGPISDNADEVAAAFAGSPTRLACICSSDGLYAVHAADYARALKAAGATTVYLAGRPRDLLPELEAAGVDRTIYVGCDVRSLLAELLDRQQVP
jgi:methylmalonyl-CoA mutase